MLPSVPRHTVRTQRILLILASSLVFLFGCSGLVQTPPTPHQTVETIVRSSQSSIRTNQAIAFSATQGGVPVTGGQWAVLGGSSNGTITRVGQYTSPSIVPTPNLVDVVYTVENTTFTGQIQIINSAPSIRAVSPQTITNPTEAVTVSGVGFVPGTSVVVNTVPIATTFIDSSHVVAKLNLSHMTSGQLQLAVANPDPGAMTSDSVTVPVVVSPLIISSSASSIRTNQYSSFSVMRDGALVSGGQWSVVGGSSNGIITQNGEYTSPVSVPTPNLITVAYEDGANVVTSQILILNPAPLIQTIAPQTITKCNESLTVSGSGFVPGSLVLVNSATVATTFIDQSHVVAKLSLSSTTSGPIKVAVANPDPGAITTDSVSVPVKLVQPTVSSPQGWVRTNQTIRFSVMQDGVAVSGGRWAVLGSSSNGAITQEGDYTSPTSVPTQNAIQVMYSLGETTVSGQIQIVNPVPTIQTVSPQSITRATNNVVVAGGGFVPGSVVLVNSAAVPTTFIDPMHLSAKLSLLHSTSGQLQITVANPDPGAITSNSLNVEILSTPISVSASQGWIRPNQTVTFSAMKDGVAVSGGQWGVLGGSSNGTITETGVFSSPSTVPTPNLINVVYIESDTTTTGQLQILNPTPIIQTVLPQSITNVKQNITVSGSGYVLGSLILVNSTPVATTYIDSTHLAAQLNLPNTTTGTLQIAVENPDPGRMVTDPTIVPVTLASFKVSPEVLTPGPVSITVSGTNISNDAVLSLDGKALVTTSRTETSLTASGYLPPWKTGTSIVGLSFVDVPLSNGEQTVPIVSTATTFEAAARFSTQAAFGPRPDVVQHIQQIGFDAFLTEQMQMPAVDYPRDGYTPFHFLHYAAEGPSLLRLRLAWALQSFIATQGIFIQQSTDPIERKLERDSTGNFRQLLADVASDTSMGEFLNLVGNAAPSDPGVHPNQNFARELMQLFTLGPVLLNNDGTAKLDATGAAIPTYDQATVIDLSRALTGWVLGTPQDPYYTAFGLDYSQPLAAVEDQHDHGPKTLFGSVNLPAGQTAAQDRDAALDAIFAHPNVPPYISRILIQRLVKSNPTPAYVERISRVFQDNGLGVRGDLAAVFRAILLDTEARTGDTAPAPDDGFLQDPLLFETFAMSVSSTTATDGQFQYLPRDLEEPFWYANSVFAYFSPSYIIPGTTINSPEFQIFNNITMVQRSEALWGMVNGGPGFEPSDSTWLYNNFPDVPSLLEALDHLLYYGRMTADQKAAILDYCNSLDPNDAKMQLRSALFLALNGDSFNVSH